MSEKQILAKIETATRRRREAWGRGDPQASAEAATRLEELYSDLRLERARRRSGDRKEISRKARISLELEKFSAGI
jgi:hypothetical protein